MEGTMRSPPVELARRVAATLVVVAALGPAGCAAGPAASPSNVAAPPPGGEPAHAGGVESTAPPIHQVRDYPGASIVTVVAWSPGEPWFGLRGHVNRSGELVGAHRIGDHRLFVATTDANELGGFTRASIVPVPPGPVLLHTGPATDPEACNRTAVCAPSSIYTIQIPDALLRARRDSLVVTFTGGRYAEWRVSLGRDLVDAYLRVVDSVAVAR
jgi:hypothetical protein